MSGSDTATTIEIALAVERLAIMFSQYRPEAVRTFGVSSQQAIILAAIYDEPGCGVKRITERTGMFQPVVSRSLGQSRALVLVGEKAVQHGCTRHRTASHRGGAARGQRDP